MVRAFMVAVSLAAPLVSAQVAPAPAPSHTEAPPAPAPAFPLAPSTAPHAALPATRPSPDQLHAQAYAFMRAGEFDKVTPLLNRAYNQTPPAQRGRALVLNRALLDLVQKRNVLRGVKDLSAWFEQNPAADEQASNILGASLDLVADNARWREGPIYAAALREFARREAAMERLRPGFKRYGARWITQEQWDEIKRQERELIRQMNELGAQIRRIEAELASLYVRGTTARKQASEFAWHSHGTDTRMPVYIDNCVMCEEQRGVREAVNDISAQMHASGLEKARLSRKYQALKKELDKLKPTWPMRYEPIDPSAPPPPPPANPPVPELEAASSSPPQREGESAEGVSR